ncbi:SAM hydrolase/SAM-dependent halogenase family protein [Halocalculus aciditolerans]|uniref:S-adenosylmethionine hydroxide adenosyltransferase n=1 Tax=Halocalculus aciditolerans TaxID=1383812 RepID=A0A830FA16_9EURY|nr:SAM-dependent chlorinase/fluorinase [Halocalculus aciditolerans]GGL69184.1 S-adenosylmethionine hydroxide adenosyltransferase [Halocalculus aciditolerans]
MLTLASDFGTPYPAAMKGVILQRTDARLVDVAHDFPRQDVRTAAFWLRETLPQFPPAVHLAVVDPGVGTDRRALVVRAGDHVLVAPDNGLVRPAARALADGGAADVECYEYHYADDATESTTFHGRDVFAPAAAEIHERGAAALYEVDAISRIDDAVDLAFPEPDVGDDRAWGEVLVVDDFGNAITNIPGGFLDGRDAVSVNGTRAPVEPAYANVDAGDRLVTVGSHGYAELAANRGRGADAFAVGVGDSVELD